jgi:beta-phosphoglucomutase-like phosphatase (HAD superfamily)
VRRDLVIFDCDGVLVDSELLSVRADRLTARGAAAVVDDMARLLPALRDYGAAGSDSAPTAFAF